MGIRSDPGYTLYGNDCLKRYPAGFTPKKIYASFTGIVKDPLGSPALPNPFNDIIVLEQNPGNACKWEASTSWGGVFLEVYTSTSALIIWGNIFMAQFNGQSGIHDQYYSNTQVPGYPYYFGSGFVSPRPPAGDYPTIQGVMALLNIEPAKKTFAEIFPVDADNSIYKFNRKADKTNVLIKIDRTLY